MNNTATKLHTIDVTNTPSWLLVKPSLSLTVAELKPILESLNLGDKFNSKSKREDLIALLPTEKQKELTVRPASFDTIVQEWCADQIASMLHYTISEPGYLNAGEVERVGWQNKSAESALAGLHKVKPLVMGDYELPAPWYSGVDGDRVILAVTPIRAATQVLRVMTLGQDLEGAYLSRAVLCALVSGLKKVGVVSVFPGMPSVPTEFSGPVFEAEIENARINLADAVRALSTAHKKFL